MIFDQLIRIAEGNGLPPEYKKVLKRCRLFSFPGIPHEVLPRTHEAGELEWMRENFFLPFQYIAVEDIASCVLLWDQEKGTKGIYTPRNFLECMSLEANPSAFFDGGKADSNFYKGFPKGACAIQAGTIAYNKVEEVEMLVSGKVAFVFVAYSGGLLTKNLMLDDLAMAELFQKTALTNASTALQEVMFFNSPDRFVLEVCPTTRKKHKGKFARRIPRSAERPVYTLLKPKEIRQQMGLAEPEVSGTKAPHERRRHTRELRSERFTDMRGKTIVIKSTWIGPSENIVGDRRYRVCLDL